MELSTDRNNSVDPPLDCDKKPDSVFILPEIPQQKFLKALLQSLHLTWALTMPLWKDNSSADFKKDRKYAVVLKSPTGTALWSVEHALETVVRDMKEVEFNGNITYERKYLWQKKLVAVDNHDSDPHR